LWELLPENSPMNMKKMGSISGTGIMTGKQVWTRKFFRCLSLHTGSGPDF
jgi:hypothetical protein